MPTWIPVLLVALAALALLRRLRRPDATAESDASPQDRALAAAVMRTPRDTETPGGVRPTPLDAQKKAQRELDGRRVRLAGAVVDGELSRDALERILIERRNPGEQAKAVRLLLQYFPLPEAMPVLTRALHANGDGFLHLARYAFGNCGAGREIGPATASVNAADEPWLLGVLLFADAFAQRAVSPVLARVGTRRSLEALEAMAGAGQPTPWIRDAITALRTRLRDERGGGLALAGDAGSEGALSTVGGAGPGSLTWSEP